ncbi:RNA polymerase sigma factor [Streptomyces chartreusis]|uniref:RNA polymerase sigma factor n=1 Tax=Streptomyces chartreusis TaxID=1969 RepID=UPI003658125B
MPDPQAGPLFVQPVGAAVIDEAACLAFYEAQIEGLLTFLARKTDACNVDGLASDIFAAFLAYWPEHPEHPNPVALLYMIAGRRLADLWRTSGRSLSFETSDLEDALGRGAGQDDDFDAVDLRIDLTRALGDLTERQRQALLLRYVAELSVQNCADVLGVGLDNMKKILKQARQALRVSPRMDTYETTATAKEVHR